MTSTAAKRKSKESKTSNNELSSSTSSINPISSRLRSTKQISVEGAGFEGIARSHTQSPNLINPKCHDPVVLVCGTNDVCQAQWDTIQHAISDLITKFQHCHRLCLLGVPFRFKNKKLNFHITRLNSKIRNYVKSTYNHVVFLDPNKFLKPGDYSIDGIHLNKFGKLKLCRKIKNVIVRSVHVTDEELAAPAPQEESVDPAPHLSNISNMDDDLINLDDDSTFSPAPLLPVNTVLFPDSIDTGSTHADNTVVRPMQSTSILDAPNFPDHVNQLLYSENHNNMNDYYRLANLSHSFSNVVHSSPLTVVTSESRCHENSNLAMLIPTVSGFRPARNEQDFRRADSMQTT
ncbi:hypothetical protein M8J76_005628 [Diaphorina citri]|nr:hypothetical protein M8J76_005628 [Diaphorina citri]